MSEALQAYRHVAASDEFIQVEKMRSKARHDEAQALRNAERRERDKWQGVVAEKDTAIAEQMARITEQMARIAELEAQLGKK